MEIFFSRKRSKKRCSASRIITIYSKLREIDIGGLETFQINSYLSNTILLPEKRAKSVVPLGGSPQVTKFGEAALGVWGRAPKLKVEVTVFSNETRCTQSIWFVLIAEIERCMPMTNTIAEMRRMVRLCRRTDFTW
jgi:hypothetical protein